MNSDVLNNMASLNTYSAFDEIMSYYHWEFAVRYFLLIVIIINVTKTIIQYYFMKEREEYNKFYVFFDLAITLFAGLGLFPGLFFQGVLSDVSAKYSNMWITQEFVVCIASFILFIVQIVYIYRPTKNRIQD